MKGFTECMVLVGVIMLSFALPSTATSADIKPSQVVDQYSEIAYAVFNDALVSAQTLEKEIHALLETPSEASLNAARLAWKAARVPYQQSEAYRFGNTNVDEWEGQLNAWPLDEGLIDYVDSEYYQFELGNKGSNANIIANTTLTIGGKTLSLEDITPELLASLNELGGSEANVATGYHAIEFLLWGQDLNGTEAGAGNRPHTDFIQGKGCTHGHCDRRAAYLKAAVALLIQDLQNMQQQWAPEVKDNYRAALQAEPEKKAIGKALFGMGSLALGELAGERMKVALEANSTEDEHDCFSDNTHYSHFYDAKGIQNIYLGRYRRIDGTLVSGPSLHDLVKQKDATLAEQTANQFETTMAALQKLVDAAEDPKAPMKFDQMIAEGNDEGANLVKAGINSLVALTLQIEKVAHTLGIEHLNPDTADHDF